MLTVAAIIHLVCRHVKLKALLTGIAFQPVNQAEAEVTKQTKEFCTAQWYAIAALTVLTILLIVYICLSNQKCTLFKRRLYSNTVTIMFFSDVRQYVPVKLCKSAGSIYLFQIYGQLDSIIRMPKTVKVPLRDKYRLRSLMDKHSLLLHIMLRQGTSWYALDKMDSEVLLPPPLQESEILHFRMANELNITQDFKTMTVNLPANTVTIHLVVKTLKGQYRFCQNNNHCETSFNPWSEDLQSTESFMKIVREMQIKPDRYYLETVMHQPLGENYGFNSYMPKVMVIEQLPSQDNNDENRTIQSPCPSNWSDDLYVVDDSDNETQNKQTNLLINPQL